MITEGSVFATPYETGCVAIERPDEFGHFGARDAGGVVCGYMISMVIELDGRTDLYVFTSAGGAPIITSASLYDAHVYVEQWFKDHPRGGARVDVTLNDQPYGYVTRKAPKSIKFPDVPVS